MNLGRLDSCSSWRKVGKKREFGRVLFKSLLLRFAPNPQLEEKRILNYFLFNIKDPRNKELSVCTSTESAGVMKNPKLIS